MSVVPRAAQGLRIRGLRVRKAWIRGGAARLAASSEWRAGVIHRVLASSCPLPPASRAAGLRNQCRRRLATPARGMPAASIHRAGNENMAVMTFFLALGSFLPGGGLLHTPHRTTTPLATNFGLDAGWSSPVARQAHNLKVAGSNPAPATKKSLIYQGFRKGRRKAALLRLGCGPHPVRTKPDFARLRAMPSYARSDALEKRRKLMEAWAAFVR